MKVYRLERNGYGVFCEYYSKIDMPFSDDALYSMFGYTCNQKYREESDFRSACDSIDKLIEYFGSDFAFALEKGADIVEYDILKKHVRFSLLPEEDNIEVVFDSIMFKERNVIYEGFKDEDTDM